MLGVELPRRIDAARNSRLTSHFSHPPLSEDRTPPQAAPSRKGWWDSDASIRDGARVVSEKGERFKGEGRPLSENVV
jgi:hypothetical protein